MSTVLYLIILPLRNLLAFQDHAINMFLFSTNLLKKIFHMLKMTFEFTFTLDVELNFLLHRRINEKAALDRSFPSIIS